MFDVRDTQLPATATDLAKALDILEERLPRLPVEMITKNPWTADARLLDHLAWEYSVDAWDSDWPESVKRAVIAASPEVHRYKGTPYGIRRSLEAFGVYTELTEWWEPGGSGVPGTFIARVFVTDPLDGASELIVTAPVIRSIRAMLNGVAPVSRGWALQFAVRASAPTYVGAYALAVVRATAECRIDPPPVSVVAATFAVLPFARIKANVTAG